MGYDCHTHVGVLLKLKRKPDCNDLFLIATLNLVSGDTSPMVLYETYQLKDCRIKTTFKVKLLYLKSRDLNPHFRGESKGMMLRQMTGFKLNRSFVCFHQHEGVVTILAATTESLGISLSA